MNSFTVSKGKLEYLGGFWSEINALEDGSVQLIKYKEYSVQKTLELNKSGSSNWMCAERYYIDIHLPKPRELAICVIVIRSSQNCYKVIYTDKLKSDVNVFNGLVDLNRYLLAICQEDIKTLNA